jgi:hypothetical protein
VAGAVNVRIVAVSGLVLNVGSVDRDTTRSLFGGLIDVRVINELGSAVQVQNLGDSGGQCGFTMVNVANGTNVYVRFVSFKLCLCHWKSSFYFS